MYIGISGIDGSGKTTISKIISDFISTNFNAKTFLCDAMKPGCYNNELRGVEKLLNDNELYDEFFSREIVNLAYSADLYENYTNIIKPKQDKGYIVISHRSRLCCRVYSEIFSEKLAIVNTIMQSVPFPDILFYLKTSPEIAMDRIYRREKKEGIPICKKENLSTFKK